MRNFILSKLMYFIHHFQLLMKRNKELSCTRQTQVKRWATFMRQAHVLRGLRRALPPTSAIKLYISRTYRFRSEADDRSSVYRLSVGCIERCPSRSPWDVLFIRSSPPVDAGRWSPRYSKMVQANYPWCDIETSLFRYDVKRPST